MIIGHYLTERDRVEISLHLKKYPELYDFVLAHELQHAKISKSKGTTLHKHIILDFKGRWTLLTENPYRTQFAEFTSEVSGLSGWRNMISAFIYELSALLQIPAMIAYMILRLRDWIDS